MLHACAVRFDMTENLKNFVNFFGTKQGFSTIDEIDRESSCQRRGRGSHRRQR